MPRLPRKGTAKEESTASTTTPTANKSCKQWVIITKDGVITTEDGEKSECHPSICLLRHPRTDSGVLFLLSADFKTVCELNCFDEKYHSWFIGDSVHGDNRIFFASPVDPLFLILPYLLNPQKSERYMALDQVVCDDDLPDCARILACADVDQISHIADRKDIDENLQVFRYSKDRTLAWLKEKVEVLADTLEAKQMSVSTKGSHSALFVRSKNSTESRECYIQYAVGMICDYLPLALEQDLRSHLDVPLTEEKTNVPPVGENEPPKKKAKLDADVTSPTDDYSLDVKKEKNKITKLTNAQKKLSKVDKTGMKSISSFFSPKS